MAPWPSQQKEHAVPQLSCVMCRDRKLKCDKLDPCTNCKASGAICSPIHRPRLPRGRHARRPSSSPRSDPPPPGSSHKKSHQGSRRQAQSGTAGTGTTCRTTPPHTEAEAEADADAATAATAPTLDGDLDTRIAALESLVLRHPVDAETSVALKEFLFSVRPNRSTTPSATQVSGGISQNMSRFLTQLEKLLQNVSDKNAEPASDREAGRPGHTLPCAEEAHMAVQSTEDPQRQHHCHPPSPPQLDPPAVSSPGTWSLGLSGDFWADLTDYQGGTHDQIHVLEPHPYTTGQDELDAAMANSGGVGCDVGDRRALRLLGPDSFLSAPNSVSLPRDTAGARKLCQVYLQNVDPIMKILHRPTLTRWMMYDSSPNPNPNKSVRALEFAVCYAAAMTMTDAQCQEAFQKSKANVSTVYRKLCEDAIEMAGLVTTRDMTVLQAFVLYLLGRRTEDKGTAVWALVALAVRLTSAMKLNVAPGGGGQPESFFQQQMRLRLWLSVCLMDLQASLAESSEHLISYQDAASAVPHVRNVNDADFDVDTAHPVDSSDEPTDTTFALVTYRVQAIGRLLNFAASSESAGASVPAGSTSSGPAGGSSVGCDGCACVVLASTPGGRRQLVRQFQQEVFGLLYYCDPESSPYAWFTWHSTHCIVAAIRLSELLPFRCGPTGSPPPPQPAAVQTRTTQNGSEVLCRAVRHLEKVQLIDSDPRSGGFRWYIAAPRLTLSAAIAECGTCADDVLVRWAWPIIETFCRQHEESLSVYRCPLSQVPLLRLLSEARERLAPLLQGGGGVSHDEIHADAAASGHHTLMSLDADSMVINSIDPLMTADLVAEPGAMVAAPSDAFAGAVGRAQGLFQ